MGTADVGRELRAFNREVGALRSEVEALRNGLVSGGLTGLGLEPFSGETCPPERGKNPYCIKLDLEVDKMNEAKKRRRKGDSGSDDQEEDNHEDEEGSEDSADTRMMNLFDE